METTGKAEMTGTSGCPLLADVAGEEERAGKLRVIEQDAVRDAALAPVTDALRLEAVGLGNV